MSNTKVAIVILNWNGIELLKTFLPDVVNHSKVEGAKVYVADNHSIDESLAYIKSNFPSVGIVELDKNYGFAGGYNRAFEQIEAEYFLLLNSDVAPCEDWLPPLLSVLDKDKDVAACVPKVKDYKNPEWFEYAGAAGGFIDKFGFPFCRGRIFNVLEKDSGQYDEQVPVFWASGAALLIRSQIYRDCGGLDEDFFAHMEEIDLCWRMKNRGYKIVAIPQSEVFHLGGGTLNEQSAHKTYLNFRNSLYMLVKNLPKTGVWRVMLMRMAIDGIAAIHFITKGEFGYFYAVLKAHISFYKHLPQLIRKRKALLPNVTKESHNEMLKGSLVWEFFVKKHRYYHDL